MITPEMLARSGTEHGEQMALFCWAGQPLKRATFPELEWLHAIPNSGARGNKVAAGQLKAEGVKAGVADVFLPVKTNRFSGLYVELKRANGFASDFSEEQLDFCRFVNHQGFCWYPAFGWVEASHVIEAYLRNVTPFLTPKQQLVLNKAYA